MSYCNNIKIYLSQIWNTISLIYNIRNIKISINNDENISEERIQAIKNNINNIGVFAIKLIQWSNERLKFISNNPKIIKIFENLDTFYEECPIHHFSFTENMYHNDFQKQIHNEIKINYDHIQSGSIGQVYEGILISNNKKIAMKCIHPEIYNHLFIPKYFLLFLNNYLTYIPYFKKYKLPLDIVNFFESLELQMDFTKEVENLNFMDNIYKNNPYIIIPKVIKYSKNIIIMTYESGESFNKISISNYKKFKIINLFKLFVRSSIYSQGFLHGDLHNGNWKVSNNKINNINPIIIYDLGICYKCPVDLLNNIQNSMDNSNFKNLLDLLLSKESLSYNPYNEIDTNNIKKEFIEKIKKNMLLSKNMDLQNIDLSDLIPVIHDIIQKGFVFDSIFFNIFITIILIFEKVSKYTENTMDYKDKEITKNNRFTVQYPALISFSKTYRIFPQYRKNMEKLLDEYTKNNIFEIFNGIDKRMDYLISK